MKSKRSRLDRFISKSKNIPIKQVKLLLAQGDISVNNQPATDAEMLIDEFTHIALKSEVLQDLKPVYIMLHKPIGVISATKDTLHSTVIDLVDHPLKDSLHIVGRLDLNTSGLVLLTNDGRWSKLLTSPESRMTKRYLVTLKNKITSDYVDAFAQGMYFEYEDITTRPARLKILTDYSAEIDLTEGKYHQIKRMFGRFRNQVVSLHRSQIGPISLDESLEPGHWKVLPSPLFGNSETPIE